MAIKFDLEKENKNQSVQEVVSDSVEVKERTKKDWLGKLTVLCLILSMFGVFYVLTYQITPLLLLLPTGVFWVLWFILIVFLSIVTLGCIWVSDGWRKFNSNFISFNTKLSNASGDVANFLIKMFPYFASFFALLVLSAFVCSIVYYIKHKSQANSGKGRMIVSIVCAVLFVGLAIFDLIVFLK